MEGRNNSLQKLSMELATLPGIGKKTAQRLAFYIITRPKEDVKRLADTLIYARENIRLCKECCTLTDSDICPVCANKNRDAGMIMVVEEPKDVTAYERTGSYNGVYHVLHGVISPMRGVAPSDIKLKELMQRLQRAAVNEVIIATSSTVEGEATAMYISQLIKPAGIKVTRIASGVPVGGDLENIDEITLLRALEGRVEL